MHVEFDSSHIGFFLSFVLDPQEVGYTLAHDQGPKLLLRAGEYEAIVQDLQVDGIIMIDGKQWHFKDLRPRHIAFSCDMVDIFLQRLKAGKDVELINSKTGREDPTEL